MAAGYIRRWTTEQAASTYLNIESVNIIDQAPPSTFAGVPFGTALLIGEFEDGPFATPTLITDQDLGEGNTFGGFGFTYAGVRYQNCAARARFADSAVLPEYWNGNGFVQLQGKKFSALVLSRVDTSVGNVAFTRAAYLNGFNKPRFNLTPTGSTMIMNFGAGDSTATFTGVPATVTGAAAAFGNIVAGNTVVLGYDAAPNFTTIFLAGDTTIANVIARINQYAGFTFASNSASQLKLTAIQPGTGGQVRVVSGDGATITSLGLTIANTAGTGNVADLTAVTPTELNTIISAANAKAAVVVLSDGTIRITNVADGAAGQLLVRSNTVVGPALGFSPLDTLVGANVGNNGTIPAGTRITGNSITYVTMQSIAVANTNPGPYSVKVRPAQDDDSVTSGCPVSQANALVTPIDVDAYTVTNPLPLSAALSESQIDAAYTTAILATEDVNSAAKEVNVSFSARQSNSVRRAMRADALAASSGGLFGRLACIRPPIGITQTQAMSSSVEPGVGPYRNERVLYCWPQAAITMDAIQSRGLAGGNGFTANGLISIGADGFLASSISQLAPGENPAQDAGFLVNIVDVDQSAASQLPMNMQNYIQLKAAGIVALRMDSGEAVFQSGVTSVDPTVDPARTDIERRTLADFIEDSMAALAAPYSKKKMTAARKAALLDAWKNFLNPLLGDADGNNQVLDSYSLTPKSTATMLAQGRYRVSFKGKSVPSFKSIKLDATVGPGVVIDETV